MTRTGPSSYPLPITLETTVTTTSGNNPTDPTRPVEDGEVFGSVNEQLCDDWATAVQEIVERSAAEALPFVTPHSERWERLTTLLLQKHYWRCIDVAEVYAARTVFSLRMFHPSRHRAAIAQYFHRHGTTNDIPESDTVMTDPEDLAEGNEAQAEALPTLHVPANVGAHPDQEWLEQTKLLQQELQLLRQRLGRTREQYMAAQQSLAYTRTAHQYAQQWVATDAIGAASVSTEATRAMTDATQKLLVDAQHLQQTRNQGRELLQQLTNQQQRRSREEKEDAERVPTPLFARGKTLSTLPSEVLSVEEQFQRDQRVFGSAVQLTQWSTIFQKR